MRKNKSFCNIPPQLEVLASVECKYVDNLWDDSVAAKLPPAERLVYRSNCLGADLRITNTGSTMLPRDRVIASLTKYNIPFEESNDDDELRKRLAQFYAERMLTKQPITPADQVETTYFLLSDRSSKTTGQVISVDGGLHEAFLR